MARISTHVLDIAKGAPAGGVGVTLQLAGNTLKADATNADGRTDSPLISAETIAPGHYELTFEVADYLRVNHPAAPPFFDRITLRFAVTDERGHYHVPLLLAPHGYSTYRGS